MPVKLSKRQLEIAVLVETDNSWGRSIIQGVADFAAKYGPWNLLIDPRDYSRRWALPERWRGDGVVARISSPPQLEEIAETGLPTVNVDDIYDQLDSVGNVRTDETVRAKMALDHFREKGQQSFAYYAPPSNEYSRSREKAFLAVLGDAGFECHVYKPGYRVSRRIDRDEQHNRVLRWLRLLPRPVAILAVDARRGRELAEVCAIENIAVPDEVAILAGDSDDLLCELSIPQLSSILVASQRIGYEAARLLYRIIEGDSWQPAPVLIPPIGVVSKQSTDALAIDDPLIVQAMRYIQVHAFQGIVVDDILREVPVSRRYLELKFKQYFGRLPAEAIRELRLDRGKELLSQSDHSVDAIASMCGYAGATQFGVAFRKKFGETPLAFRKHLNSSDE